MRLRDICRAPGVRRALWIDGHAENTGIVPAHPGHSGPRSYERTFLERLAPGEVLHPPVHGCARLEAIAGGSLVLARPPAGSGDGLLWLELDAGQQPGGREVLRMAEGVGRAAQVQLELQEAWEREHLSRIGERSAALFHDLRNELTYGMLLLEGAGGDLKPLARHLRQIRDLCQAGLAAGEAARARVSRVALAPLIRREALAAERLSLSEGRPREAFLDCPEDIQVWSDPSLLGRLMQNLLLNAMAASPWGKAIAVRVRSTGGGQVEVSVRDRGCGMDEHRRASLSRAGKSGRSGGTGFGFSSIDDCARSLRARLRVESEPAVGTHVHFQLDQAPPEGCDHWVLVDGDRQRREERTLTLRDQGIYVCPCPDPAAAVGAIGGGGVARVLLARGTPGPHLADLRRTCLADAIPLEVMGAGSR